MMKKSMYNELVEALENSGQTAAAEILKSISTNGTQPEGSTVPLSPGAASQTPVKDCRALLIGDGDGAIKIANIREHVESKSLLASKVVQDWKELATKLGFDFATKERWAKDIRLDKRTEIDVFEQMVTDWVNTFEDGEVTLGTFLDILTGLKSWKAFHTSLEKHFSST